MENFFNTPLKFLKGVGPVRAELLGKELGLFTYGDLLNYFPFRYDDRSKIAKIADIATDTEPVQVQGQINDIQMLGHRKSQRLSAWLADGSGEMELLWFNNPQWFSKNLIPGQQYIVYGKPKGGYRGFQMVHPEIDLADKHDQVAGYLRPVYHTTELLKKRRLDSRVMVQIVQKLLEKAQGQIPEFLPTELLQQHQLCHRQQAFLHIHTPPNTQALNQAQHRIKFEELFLFQLKMVWQKQRRTQAYKGLVFENQNLVTHFYKQHLPFELTGAQKKVLGQINHDLKSGQQMNRLLQGDVGSGKTIVAFISMLMAIDSQTQACLMAPTEILATQHHEGLQAFAQAMGLQIALLTGSTKAAQRNQILDNLSKNKLQIIIGTHALLEERVQFAKLGLVVIDEQHRFGVAQRARLWGKNKEIRPHILVMTATPIPRTLALTFYGDLEVSTIDELPPGRKPVRTAHRYQKSRTDINNFILHEIEKGRQAYIVFPLIEESEKLDLQDLQTGFENIKRQFATLSSQNRIGMLHGKMKPADKQAVMDQFAANQISILVSTTVIEVGVNVPNATIMLIENAERFGLSQLHQLRGRVGRGAERSYCILLTGDRISQDGRVRMKTMCSTNNGFTIADVDMQLRGPGDVLGTRQSGDLNFRLANLIHDHELVLTTRKAVDNLLTHDANLEQPHLQKLKTLANAFLNSRFNWSRIS